ncbi:MAG: LptA/OstA family protein [Bosea sp. (in: a-proteobacteria)]|uniref:LptA/OstA family protein n=1 Tax=Bosea sp. (in: a-proteobacteria) TaxID=1871050 RepID=UPI00273548F1|nr:LptA/OstA family protein [Bosea sp. (in: a-proteobacteria)]MDP3254630.1 LptA/OstA family protein [Bosea sp. (in: a-proteobacteria)]MDP3318549.1 LptA/OstA family protein [Bosea sp. (in: a-proteobacteria)]
MQAASSLSRLASSGGRVAAFATAFVILALACAPQEVAAQAKARGGAGASSPLGGLGGDSKEPIKIDADKLDVLDKENRAVFSGNVVAVQGETTVRCSIMTVFYEGRGGQGAGAKPAAATPAAAPGQGNDSSIKRIECRGPVTVVSKTQAATSDNAVFDRANNTVVMTGNVALNDGPNITRGEKLTYNTVTGIANVETTKGGRVQGFFVPNAAEANKGAPGAKPATPTN